MMATVGVDIGGQKTMMVGSDADIVLTETGKQSESICCLYVCMFLLCVLVAVQRSCRVFSHVTKTLNRFHKLADFGDFCQPNATCGRRSRTTYIQ